ncbi:MAG: hypothetical protein J0M24_27560 [Verrucomicrobia bacterium]|nr:hypothetical protein [Verrucomicrobiota bacterium]
MKTYPYPCHGGLMWPLRLLLVLILWAWGSTRLAQAQIDAQVTPAGTLLTENYANDLKVVGQNVFVAGGLAGLEVFDLTQSQRIAQLGLEGDVHDLVVVNQTAYLAVFDQGLVVVDISNPANPVKLAQFSTLGPCLALSVQHNVAYLANGVGGLACVDVSAPANPQLLGQLDTAGEAAGIFVTNGIAYVADGSAGLVLIDVSNPNLPTRINSLRYGGYSKAVEVANGLAFVAGGESGLHVIDVSTSSSLQRLGGISASSGRSYGVTLAGSVAYVADLYLGLQIYDISTPSQPRLISDPIFTLEGYTVELVGTRAYLADGLGGIRIFDVRLGLSQTLTLTPPPPTFLPLNTPTPLEVTASSGLPITLQIFGPATLANGQLTATNNGPITLDWVQSGNAEYLPVQKRHTMNIPSVAFRRQGEFNTSGSAQDLRVVGQRAYIADGTSGLQILDLTQPFVPTLLGTFNTSGNARGLDLVGSTAYVADGLFGLQIIDVSNPALPVLLGSLDTPGNSRSVQVVGDYAYLADESSGLRIIDISNPTQPREVGSFEPDTGVDEVLVDGNRAYVATGGPGLIVVDVSQPAKPLQLGRVNTSGSVSGIRLLGQYVVALSSALEVFDLRDPNQPVLVSELRIGGLSLGIAGHTALIGNFFGLQVVDLSSPQVPLTLGRFDRSQSQFRIQTVGNLAYIAQGEGGLSILNIETGLPQVITWDPPRTLVFDGTPLALAGTSSSGNPVIYSVTHGPGRIENNTLIVTGFGRITLRATEAGTGGYLPSTLEKTLTVQIPQLKTDIRENGVAALWPAGLSGLVLQGRDTLDSLLPWQTITRPQAESQGQVQVMLEALPYQFFRLAGFSGQPEPVELKGWNRDVVLEDQSNARALQFDSFGAVWFESRESYAEGFPRDRVIRSQLDPAVLFELQPYNQANVLWLPVSKPTNSLELVTPAAYSKLFVLAHSAGGGGNGTVRIHFTDGTVSEAIPYFAPDWWDGAPGTAPRRPALQGLARSQSPRSLSYDYPDPGFSLHQTDLDLTTGPNAGKKVLRLEFSRGIGAETTGILAVSGVQIPEP